MTTASAPLLLVHTPPSPSPGGFNDGHYVPDIADDVGDILNYTPPSSVSSVTTMPIGAYRADMGMGKSLAGAYSNHKKEEPRLFHSVSREAAEKAAAENAAENAALSVEHACDEDAADWEREREEMHRQVRTLQEEVLQAENLLAEDFHFMTAQVCSLQTFMAAPADCANHSLYFSRS
jgi:hypothetical protein